MKITRTILTLCIALLMTATVAQAIPTLQLDIADGWYDPQSATTIASGDKFTLFAYLTPQNNSTDLQYLLSQTYYVSAALVPVSDAGDYGTFDFNGETVNVTKDMTFGTPPQDDSTKLFDAGDLQKHGIFNTYYSEFNFTFSPYVQTTPYDVQDNTGQGPTGGTGMYWAAFDVNTANLAPGYEIHFDLYNECTRSGSTDIDVALNAPFSHDAQSGHKVPEPSSLWLIGMGLAGVGLYGRKRS